MARLARVVAAGLPHHVTQRRNRRQPVFFGEGDCKPIALKARNTYDVPGIHRALTADAYDARGGEGEVSSKC